MDNPLRIKRIHHVEFLVGNARQAAFFYRKAFGFSQIAYRGQETGSREMASYALTQGKANFVVSTPLTPSHPAAEHIKRHGDGIRDIALEVGDADLAFEQALARGAEAAEAPHDLKDEFGTVRQSRDPHLWRHHSLASLAARIQRPVPAGLCRAENCRRRCGHPAHRSHGGQRRAWTDESLGRLLFEGIRLPSLHQL